MNVVDGFLGGDVKCALATVVGEHRQPWHAYPEDTFIYLHKGWAQVETRNGAHTADVGERLCVPAGVEHRIHVRDAVVELLLPSDAEPYLP